MKPRIAELGFDSQLGYYVRCYPIGVYATVAVAPHTGHEWAAVAEHRF